MTNENGAATDYVAQGRQFLTQAYEELAKDDLRQASEKGWGATAQAIKAVAHARGAEHKGHGHLVAISRALASEHNDPELRHRFNAGAELHTNFYEGYYDSDEIAERLERVSVLVDQIESLLNGRNGASAAE